MREEHKTVALWAGAIGGSPPHVRGTLEHCFHKNYMCIQGKFNTLNIHMCFFEYAEDWASSRAYIKEESMSALLPKEAA